MGLGTSCARLADSLPPHCRQRWAGEARVIQIGGVLLTWLLSLMAFFLQNASANSAASANAESEPSLDSRPNIIFLLTDDQRADTLSIAGHPVVETPNIDAIARRGIRYSNAFTVQPICAPSRFAFLSGQYERTSGLGFNSPYQVNDAQWAETYPALLRRAGYVTGFIGKFGVQFYSLPGGASSQFDYWRAHDGWLPFFPKDLPENPATTIYRDAQHDITTEIMGEYIGEFLNARPTDRPFMLSVSFSAPHNSVVSSMFPEGAASDCDNYACRVMGYPANANPKLTDHPIYDALYRNQPIAAPMDTGLDPYRFIPSGVIDHNARQRWYAYNYLPNLEPEHLIRYYQTITGIDRVIGELTAQLQAQGIDDNTVIIFSSDHGLLNGEYGTGGKALLYDLVAKIPLIVFDPRDDLRDDLRDDSREETAAGRIDDSLVLSIDVPASILALAEVDTPEAMEGMPLTPQGSPRDEVFLESLTVAEGNPFIEALRTQRWKYVRYFEAAGCPYTEDQLDFSEREPMFEQLFDLHHDPQERTNLAGKSEYGTTLEKFRARLAAESATRTERGRRYKREQPVAQRTADGVYCW